MRNRNGIKLLAVLTAVTISFPIQSLAGEWRQNGNQWQYILENGQIQKDSWLKTDDGKWYHFDENGLMRTGWYQDKDQKWYYLEEGGFMASGWKQIDGKWYYLDKQSGEAILNGYTPDGFYVDGTGAWNGSSSQNSYDDDSSDDDWRSIPGENGGNQPGGEQPGETNPWENKTPVMVEQSGIVSVMGLPYAVISFSNQAEGVEEFRYSVAGKDATSLVTPVTSSGNVVKIPLPDENEHTVAITSGKWTVSVILLNKPGKSSVVEKETAEANISLPSDIPWVVIAEETIPLTQYVKFIRQGDSIFVKSDKTTADALQIQKRASLMSMGLDAVASATEAPPASMEGKEETASIAVLFDLAANHVITDELGIETASGEVFLAKWNALNKKIALNDTLTLSTEAKDLKNRNWKKASELPTYVKYLTDKAGYGTKVELLTGKTDNTIPPQLFSSPSLKGKDALIRLSDVNESWYRSITEISIPYSDMHTYYYQENNTLSKDGKTITLGVDKLGGPMNQTGTYEIIITSFGFEDVKGTLTVVDQAPEFTPTWEDNNGRLKLRANFSYYSDRVNSVTVNGIQLDLGLFSRDINSVYIPYGYLVNGKNTFEIQAEGYEDTSFEIESPASFVTPRKAAEVTVNEVTGGSTSVVFNISSYPEGSQELEWFQALEADHLKLSYSYGAETILSLSKGENSFTVTSKNAISVRSYTMQITIPGYDIVTIAFTPVNGAPAVTQNWNLENYNLKLTSTSSSYLSSYVTKVFLNGRELIKGEGGDYTSSYEGIELFAHNFTAGEPYTIQLHASSYTVKNLEGTAPAELTAPLAGAELHAEPVSKGSEVTVTAGGEASEWLDKISSVTVANSYSSSGTAAAYTKTENGLILNSSNFFSSGVYTITVKAVGYRTVQTTVKILNTVTVKSVINYDEERLELEAGDSYFYDKAIVVLNGTQLKKNTEYTVSGKKLYIPGALLKEEENRLVLNNEEYQKVEMAFDRYIAAKTPPKLEVKMESSMAGENKIVLDVKNGDQEWWDSLNKSYISVKRSLDQTVSDYIQDSEDQLTIELEKELSYYYSYIITISVPGYRSCSVTFNPYQEVPELVENWLENGDLQLSTESYGYFSSTSSAVYLDGVKLVYNQDYTLSSSWPAYNLTIYAKNFKSDEHVVKILNSQYAPYEITLTDLGGRSMINSLEMELILEKPEIETVVEKTDGKNSSEESVPEEVPSEEVLPEEVPSEEVLPEEVLPEEIPSEDNQEEEIDSDEAKVPDQEEDEPEESEDEKVSNSTIE